MAFTETISKNCRNDDKCLEKKKMIFTKYLDDTIYLATLMLIKMVMFISTVCWKIAEISVNSFW